ncbi:MarR family winged helix-turn-helix transcriptional regulator [Amorphus orientalis]|uniref:DNA-binding MarR family transcriptional regulator n=1 Tax=Amorphus orientalis TaxID=649198 RepID=A0AAE3VRM2_9HYPH|nr:MarR family winged helix-turn-helix transcriptional regulator [Amorphus orientalis]MDQ0316897.1 DNA-binding MarR family transcriptional regulator [Amorphus orientalis]
MTTEKTDTSATAARSRSRDPQERPWASTEALHRGLELHFFAHLNLAEDADRTLTELGFGRTHHRILYFVSQTPGITVGEMLSILRVTHQNVQRPMGELLRKGLIEQKTSMTDRRQRQLYITEAGQELFDRLTARQFDRIARAYEAAGPDAVRGFWTVLWHMIDDGDRAWLEENRIPSEA